MVIFIMGRVQVLVGSVRKCCCDPSSEYQERPFKGKACSDLIKSENNLLMIREPLTMLTPFYTKPLSKVHLSIKSSWTNLLELNILTNSCLLKINIWMLWEGWPMTFPVSCIIPRDANSPASPLKKEKGNIFKNLTGVIDVFLARWYCGINLVILLWIHINFECYVLCRYSNTIYGEK